MLYSTGDSGSVGRVGAHFTSPQVGVPRQDSEHPSHLTQNPPAERLNWGGLHE